VSIFDGLVVAYDCESSGIDVFNDRIVTACVVRIEPGSAPKVRSTVINPGIEIPEAASQVNGYTTDRVRAEGVAPVPELTWIADELIDTFKAGRPVIIANAVFDLTILNAELRRHGLPDLFERMGDRVLAPVLDPIVLDKKVEKFRRRVSPTQGARCLKTLAQVHGVGWDDDLAHTAEYDALQAGRVTWQLMRRYPRLAEMTLNELHMGQVGWYAEQQVGLAAFFRKKASQVEFEAERAVDDGEREVLLADSKRIREDADSVNTSWPILPFGGEL
jgi:DNA polymerase-3 subunit epsilon